MHSLGTKFGSVGRLRGLVGEGGGRGGRGRKEKMVRGREKMECVRRMSGWKEEEDKKCGREGGDRQGSSHCQWQPQNNVQCFKRDNRCQS